MPQIHAQKLSTRRVPCDLASRDGAMPAEMLVALVESREDRVAIEMAADGVRVQFCSRARDVIALLADVSVVAVVLELRAAWGGESGDLFNAIRQRLRPISLLVRFDVRPEVFRAHGMHFSEEGDMQYSVRGFDELSLCVRSLLSARAITSARTDIVSRLTPQVPHEFTHILVAAAAAGERDCSVPSFAQLCGVPTRTLQDQLCTLGLPTPKRMLMLMLAAHTHYRVTENGILPKRAASIAGLTNDKLSRRIERATGSTLARFCRTSSFADVLAWLADEMR